MHIPVGHSPLNQVCIVRRGFAEEFFGSIDHPLGPWRVVLDRIHDGHVFQVQEILIFRVGKAGIPADRGSQTEGRG